MNNKGQSTVEFLSGLTISFAFVFFFVKLALNYTNGYLVHYATFMASRNYLVSNSGLNFSSSPEARAKEVFNSFYLDKVMVDFDGELRINSNETNIIKAFVGVYAIYSDRLSFSKLIGGKIPMEFRSESFLGKEPRRDECAQRVCDALESSGIDCSEHVTLFDNGC